jgi:hypothetical protein
MRSWSAFTYGTACIVGTIIVLYGHIRGIDDLTITHLYISLALIVALGSGHFMWDAFSDGRFGWIRGLAFTLLFVVGTVICVGMSGGRSSAVIEANERAQVNIEVKRKQLASRATSARNAADAAHALSDERQKEADTAARVKRAECDKGKGIICNGKTESFNTADAAAKEFYDRFKEADIVATTIQKELDALPPPTEANAELRSFAKVYALITGTDEASSENAMKQLLPYLLALITEFGGITFYKHAFGAKQVIIDTVREVSIAEISRELAIEPRIARKVVRQLNIARPPQGWSWPRNEADIIKQRIAVARSTVH